MIVAQFGSFLWLPEWTASTLAAPLATLLAPLGLPVRLLTLSLLFHLHMLVGMVLETLVSVRRCRGEFFV
jgi:hypothetical protein